jgi:hypothetical protein
MQQPLTRCKLNYHLLMLWCCLQDWEKAREQAGQGPAQGLKLSFQQRAADIGKV